MRVGRQVQQDIFAEKGCEIDQFRPRQIEVYRKCFSLNVEWKRLQTANAAQFDWLSQRASRPKRPLGDSQVERVAQRANAADILPGQFRK